MTDYLPIPDGMTISRILRPRRDGTRPAHWQWLGQRDYMWQLVDAQVPPVRITMEKTLAEYRANLQVEQAEIAKHSSAFSGKKKWKTKDGIYQLKDPEPSEQVMPGTDDAIYADLLREV